MSPGKDIDWMLDTVLAVAETQHAVVLSADGLPLARSAGLDADDADVLAAACSGLQSLGRGVASRFGTGGGDIEQVMVEYRGGYLVLIAAGEGAVLAVVTSPSADLALVVQQMYAVVAAAGDHLTSPARGVPGAVR